MLHSIWNSKYKIPLKDSSWVWVEWNCLLVCYGSWLLLGNSFLIGKTLAEFLMMSKEVLLDWRSSTSNLNFTHLLKRIKLIYIGLCLAWPWCCFCYLFTVRLPENLQTCRYKQITSPSLPTLIRHHAVTDALEGKWEVFFKRNVSCSLMLTWMQSIAGGDHPTPFSLFDWNPSCFFSFPQGTSGFSVASSIWTFVCAPCREDEDLAAGQGPVLQPHCLPAVAGWTEAGNPYPAAVQSPKWCTVHTMLLDKGWWHRTLSLLFWGSDHYPNGLCIVVMEKILMASMSIALDYFKSD